MYLLDSAALIVLSFKQVPHDSCLFRWPNHGVRLLLLNDIHFLIYIGWTGFYNMGVFYCGDWFYGDVLYHDLVL